MKMCSQIHVLDLVLWFPHFNLPLCLLLCLGRFGLLTTHILYNPLNVSIHVVWTMTVPQLPHELVSTGQVVWGIKQWWHGGLFTVIVVYLHNIILVEG